MGDFLQNLDPNQLVVVETILSFAISPFAVPAYNFPLFLFGIYAQENSESAQALKLFTGLLGGSAFLDIVWFFRNSQNWFIKLISVIILLLKGPTFFSFLTALRQRGEQFSGLNIRGGDLAGPTVWSMPGGFSSAFGGGGSREGYQSLDRDVEAQAAQPKPTPPTHASPPGNGTPVGTQP